MNDLSSWRTRGVPQNEQPEPKYFSRREPEEVPLSHYWNILVKRRNIIVPIFLVILLAGSYFALSATKLYRASATIKIEPQNPQVTGINELQPLDWRGEYDYYQTQFALLSSRPLAARVIIELGLDSNRTFRDAQVVSPNPIDHVKAWISRALGFVSYHLAPLYKSESDGKGSQLANRSSSQVKLEPELSLSPGLISRYLGFINIEPIKKTRLVRVHFTTPDPALSQALANAHVENFMRMSLEGRFSLTREARDFLEEKKSELRRRLEKAEMALNNFRRSHGVVSVEKGENIVVDRLVDFNKQLTAARAQRIEAESLYRTVENRNNQELAEVMKQGLVQHLKSNVATLEAEKARVATVFRPDHPRIQELNQQIAAARQAFDDEIAQAVRGIKSSYSAALAKERGLEAEAEKQQHAALRLRELGVDYTLLQEEVNANRSLYESVLKRLSETNVASDLAVSNMQIAERAAMPRGSSGPDVGMYLLASMVSGLFLGIGAAFLREFADSGIATPEVVWRSVGLGTLGVIPELKGRGMSAGRLIDRVYSRQKEASKLLPPPRSAAKDLVLNQSSLSIVSESYRTIRTSLLLSQPEKPPRVILLTSPSPGEGKTVTSLNLAIALAEDGYSVVLVDADMRKGCCHERLGLGRNGGLSNVLSGGLLLRDALQQTSVERLALLSRGIPPPNPTELLGSRKMKEVLTELRQRYDFIIIDSPPVIAISDASILSVIAEGVLLVLNAQTTSIPYAQKAVERLDVIRAHLLGVILNAVNLDDPHYSYYQSYKAYYTNGIGNDAGVDINGHASVYVQSEKSRETSQRLASTEEEIDVGRLKNVNGNGARSSKSPRPSFEPAVEEPFVTADKPLTGLSLNQAQAAGPLTNCTLNRVIEALSDAIGPIAPIIVQEHIAALGESRYGFPEHRIDELVKSLQAAITDAELQSFSKNLVGKDSLS
jgi:polysaccharide biosynthesis transport protein